MGLTGIIYSCTFKLIKVSSNLIHQETIKSKNLKETILNIIKSNKFEYNVAWLDTSASGVNLGRSILFRGNHVIEKKKIIKFNTLLKKKIFNIFPDWILNSLTINILNILFYRFTNAGFKNINIDRYFYQLDKLQNSNELYGKKGFISYQFVVPYRNSEKCIREILGLIVKNKIYSFVSVLKNLGKKDGYLSFGIKGFTLVFDFPIYKNIENNLSKIDDIVIKYKGRIYLPKDSRIKYQKFKKMKSGFSNKKFVELRKIKKKYFSSNQSERLGI